MSEEMPSESNKFAEEEPEEVKEEYNEFGVPTEEYQAHLDILNQSDSGPVNHKPGHERITLRAIEDDGEIISTKEEFEKGKE